MLQITSTNYTFALHCTQSPTQAQLYNKHADKLYTPMSQCLHKYHLQNTPHQYTTRQSHIFSGLFILDGRIHTPGTNIHSIPVVACLAAHTAHCVAVGCSG